VDENCVLVGYYARSILTTADGTYKLSQNVSKKWPLLAA